MLNIACGSILAALFGETATFDIHPPLVSSHPVEAWSALVQDPNTLGFLVDDAPMLLQFFSVEAAGIS